MRERTRRGEVRRKAVWGACALLLAAGAPAGAQTPASLSQLSLEELLSIQVTSASRKEETLATTPAAICVITADDIRRSGLTTLPEILRLAPGLQVARIDSNKWAISARGFDNRFANKMQVLVDGRTIYTPLFSGVRWDQQDLLLEDIDRIEIIRGPGAAVWGANAVNGVINIVTKRAQATRGTLVVLGSGNEDVGRAAVRVGGPVGEAGAYRVYAKGFDRHPWEAPVASSPSWDLADWRNVESGFRMDLSPSSRDEVTVHGDASSGRFDQVVDLFDPSTATSGATLDRLQARGANVLGRWTRRLRGPSSFSLQASYDYARSQEAVAGDVRHTVALEFQHHRAFARRHDVLWGVDLRSTWDRVVPGQGLRFTPERETDVFSSVYGSDEIALASGRVSLSLAARLEHSNFTGFELEPDVRVHWQVDSRQMLWVAVSRAVRTPSRSERGMHGSVQIGSLPDGTPLVGLLTGAPGLRPETLVAWQAGWRAQPSAWLLLDATGYVNAYSRLILYELGTPMFVAGAGAPFVAQPLVSRNGPSLRTGGVELTATMRPSDTWRLEGTYTWLEADHGGATAENVLVVGVNPEQQASVRSLLNLPWHMELDAAIYRTGALRLVALSAYTRADVRVGWRGAGPLELSVSAQNLFGPPHFEFGRTFNEYPVAIGRTVYAKATWRF